MCADLLREPATRGSHYKIHTHKVQIMVSVYLREVTCLVVTESCRCGRPLLLGGGEHSEAHCSGGGERGREHRISMTDHFLVTTLVKLDYYSDIYLCYFTVNLPY